MSGQYFFESVLPVIFLLAVTVIIVLFAGWLTVIKTTEIFMSLREKRVELLRSRRLTLNENRAIQFQADAITAMVAELSDPTKRLILGDTISQDVQGLLYEAQTKRAELPAFTREDRA